MPEWAGSGVLGPGTVGLKIGHGEGGCSLWLVSLRRVSTVKGSAMGIWWVPTGLWG